jgi:hypothetical protein
VLAVPSLPVAPILWRAVCACIPPNAITHASMTVNKTFDAARFIFLVSPGEGL